MRQYTYEDYEHALVASWQRGANTFVVRDEDTQQSHRFAMPSYANYEYIKEIVQVMAHEKDCHDCECSRCGGDGPSDCRCWELEEDRWVNKQRGGF